MGLVHHPIPPRSANHNAICERLHGTVFNEFFQPHFQRDRVDDIALLEKSLHAWIRTTTTTARIAVTTRAAALRYRSNANSSSDCGTLPPDLQPQKSADANRHPNP